MAVARALLTTLGSLGDVLPMLALANALRLERVDVAVATSQRFRHIVVRAGHTFIAIGDDEDPMQGATLHEDASVDFIDRANFTQLDRLFEDLLAAATGVHVIVAPYHVVPAHLVAERLAIPYVACAFSPAHLPGVAERIKTPIRWHTALHTLRERAGLPRALLPYAGIFNGAALVLGLFPRFLLPSHRVRLPTLHVVGYPRPPAEFQDAADTLGAAPCDEDTVVVSFGSYADRLQPGHFFQQTVAACRDLRLKCLYLSRFVTAEDAPDMPDLQVRRFVAHDAVYPHAGIVVHHGGLGTMMAACRHARPMVIVPFFYDQPYHARRMNELLGIPNIPASRFDRHALGGALVDVLARREELRRNIAQLTTHETDGAPAAARHICGLIERSSSN